MTLSLTNNNQSVYTVATPVYEGPLDLLLQLIERAELDVTKVALAEVTNPFLAYVRTLQNYRADEVSNFLVIAARLMQIKSEALLPRPIEREPDEEDPGDALVRQLLAYKRYKEIAAILGEREDYGLKTYPRLAPPPKGEPVLDLSGIDAADLHSTALALFTALARVKPINTVIRPPRITIREKITEIINRLKKGEKASFQKLLGSQSSKIEVIVTFLALLELSKQFRINTRQEMPFGEIEIEVSEDLSDLDDLDIEFTE